MKKRATKTIDAQLFFQQKQGRLNKDLAETLCTGNGLFLV
jgi:hypothetical protein